MLSMVFGNQLKYRVNQVIADFEWGKLTILQLQKSWIRVQWHGFNKRQIKTRRNLCNQSIFKEITIGRYSHCNALSKVFQKRPVSFEREVFTSLNTAYPNSLMSAYLNTKWFTVVGQTNTKNQLELGLKIWQATPHVLICQSNNH